MIFFFHSKVSNEVIRKCSTKINLDDIFNGNVKDSISGLKQSINCCNSWKTVYGDVKKIHLWHSSHTEKWVLDQTSIFAQVDAFVQRCKDLLEVILTTSR